MKHLFKTLIFNFLSLFFIISISLSEIVEEIKIFGNDRIPNETILMFSDLTIGDDIINSDLNKILKSLYNSNFFEDVSIKINNNIVSIQVVEAPLIQNIIYSGLKAKKFEEFITKNSILKPKNAFNKNLLNQDIELIKSQFRFQGFYFSKIEAKIEKLSNNLVNIEYIIDMGEKSKISKISFIGDKIYKNKTLMNVIVSEEYKFWKIISGKKYLQEELINLDTRLLKNFYLNEGFYNAKVNSSFAKLTNKEEFELIFNITPGQKFFFNDLNLVLPNDINENNYLDLNNLLKDLKDKKYSLNSVENILEEIDTITTLEEFKSVNASIEETIINNKIDINFVIEESEKLVVEKINIYGNNVTRENVIRNQFEIDEGDPFNEILTKKTENNIKSLNFFKSVKTSVDDGNDENSKIININVEEKPTGEIMAGAGAGTDGGSVFFGVKENNYLGKGLAVDANATVSADTFKGELNLRNPNFKNTDKSVYLSLQSIEIDQLKKFGYKTNKNGFEIGTSFEYLKDFNLSLSTSSYFEKISTDSTASARQKAQSGNYFDNFLNLNFNLDKRNQKFKPTDGYYSNYNLKLPVISDTNSLTNSYDYKVFSEFSDNTVTSLSILLRNTFSLTNEDVKLSERLYVPSKKLRGFETGKIGPKDGGDFIGGNYLTAINLQSTLPIIFEDSQNLDAIIFFDAANVWGIDYDSNINDGSKIRSSIGFGVDWLTPIGPLNFSLAEVITKHKNDVEESFRFNLGTTF